MIRKATAHDLPAVLSVITDGQAYLKRQGLPQWQNGTGPQPGDIEGDVARGEGYVLEVRGRVCGYASLCAGVEPSYAGITDGAWVESGGAYLTVHRVAVRADARGQGQAAVLMKGLLAAAASRGVRDVRVDTHPGNAIMQRVIVHAGFRYCGMVRLPFKHGERRAYQVILPWEA